MTLINRLALLFIAAVLYSCNDPAAELPQKRVFVLGVDGMDYAMTDRLMAEGRMPNFTHLSNQGLFQRLETSVPPLSPVAWSDFITGMDSGGHGIFDFLHRDPAYIIPQFSMSKAEPPSRYLSIGSWKLPLDHGRVRNLREGEVFWRTLQEHGVRSTIVRIPANYPPVGAGERELSGMGTPDLLGSYGFFTFITTQYDTPIRSVDGGEIQRVREKNGIVQAVLKGPPNPFRDTKLPEPLELPFEIYRDKKRNAVLLRISDKEVRLQAGEWTFWIPVEFEMIPAMPIGPGILNGMVRFYLRSADPEIELYVSPINFDPIHPDTELSQPIGFVTDLAEKTGRFYTQGMPEDTKALEQGVLTTEEFFEQARLSTSETLASLDILVEEFLQDRRSFLFYYLGHLDQISHVIWKSTDPEHPAYDSETDPKWAAKLENLYIEIDTLVGSLAERLGDNASLVVMSDHGFAPWRREMDLNGWLHKQGYLVLKPKRKEGRELFVDVDWSRTKAYGLGFNGLYLNLKGREKDGIVSPADKNRLLDEIRQQLLAVEDPATGLPAVTKVYISEEYFQDQGALQRGPDLIVGYAYGTRVTSLSALGAVASSEDIFSDHLDPWSGDHAMDHRTVPGILLTNRPLSHPVDNLRTLSAALVAEFGLGGHAKSLPDNP